MSFTDPADTGLDSTVPPTAIAPVSPTPPAPPVLAIGDIRVSATTITTPNGVAPLKGSTWIVLDQTTVYTRIPPYAIILAIVFAVFCLLGLLFLLIKEEIISGYVNVTVSSGGLQHTTQVPVRNAWEVAGVRASVAHAQALAAAAAA